MGNERMFKRYIGIDYSGQLTSTDTVRKLAVCCGVGDAKPKVVGSPADGCDVGTRRGIAHWLVKRLMEQDRPTLVGIDHGFSFPIPYFNHYLNRKGLEGGWDCFLDDFQKCWQTDEPGVKVTDKYYDQFERMMKGKPNDCRFGRGDWFRLTDPIKPRASSVFDFMAGSRNVAHQTHAGLPWLRYIRRELRKEGVKVHFWPFDGWAVPPRTSVVVEVYPGLWKEKFNDEIKDVINRDKRDAYRVARWMSVEDGKCSLGKYFKPDLNAQGCARAKKEGWILGVLGARYPGYRRPQPSVPSMRRDRLPGA